MAAVRPHYETASDLEHEERARQWIEQRSKVDILKLSEAAWTIDWAGCKCISPDKNGLVGMTHTLEWFAEYKHRTTASGTFSHYMIAAAKWMKLGELADRFGVPAFLIVEFTDGLFVARYHAAEIGVGARTDRDDPYDTEPMAFIAAEKFKRVRAWSR